MPGMKLLATDAESVGKTLPWPCNVAVERDGHVAGGVSHRAPLVLDHVLGGVLVISCDTTRERFLAILGSECVSAPCPGCRFNVTDLLQKRMTQSVILFHYRKEMLEPGLRQEQIAMLERDILPQACITRKTITRFEGLCRDCDFCCLTGISPPFFGFLASDFQRI